MMQRSGFWLGTIALLALAANAVAKDDVDEARKAIDAANEAYAQAVAKKDTATIANLYTKDAMVLPPDAEMITGSKTGIEALWKEQFAAGVKSFKLETLNVERSGDVAVETGRVTVTIAPKGQPEMSVPAKYVVVWKKEDGGAWKLHRDIWNNDPSPKSETTASTR